MRLPAACLWGRARRVRCAAERDGERVVGAWDEDWGLKGRAGAG